MPTVYINESDDIGRKMRKTPRHRHSIMAGHKEDDRLATKPPHVMSSMGSQLSHISELTIRRPSADAKSKFHSYLGHMKADKVINAGHNTTPAHPGFKAVQAKIAAKQGVSKERAGAMLAARTRAASAGAKRRNPRLKRVKG